MPLASQRCCLAALPARISGRCCLLLAGLSAAAALCSVQRYPGLNSCQRAALLLVIPCLKGQVWGRRPCSSQSPLQTKPLFAPSCRITVALSIYSLRDMAAKFCSGSLAPIGSPTWLKYWVLLVPTDQVSRGFGPARLAAATEMQRTC